MAITHIHERWEDRGADLSEEGVRTLTRGWAVTTDSDSDGEPEVIDAVGAQDPSAKQYAPHPKYTWAVCRRLSAKPHKSAKVWLVSSVYSSAGFEAKGDGTGESRGESGAGAGGGTAPDVTVSNQTVADERLPTLSVARKEITEVLERDVVNGDRVLNTVGDPLDPLPEVFRSHHVFTAKFFRRPERLKWTSRSLWLDSINSEPVELLGKVHAPYTLRCIDYAVDTMWETGPTGMMLFFSLVVQIEYDPEGWGPKILNTGRRKLIGDGFVVPFKKVEIVDAHGQAVKDPVPLDENGTPVPPGGTYYYLEPNGYKVYDWNGTDGTVYGNNGILG